MILFQTLKYYCQLRIFYGKKSDPNDIVSFKVHLPLESVEMSAKIPGLLIPSWRKT